MIRDNGPTFLFAPVKMMKEAKGKVQLDHCLPLNKCAVLHEASPESVAAGKAVTVLTCVRARLPPPPPLIPPLTPSFAGTCTA
jgi:hypothetical protein